MTGKFAAVVGCRVRLHFFWSGKKGKKTEAMFLFHVLLYCDAVVVDDPIIPSSRAHCDDEEDIEKKKEKSTSVCLFEDNKKRETVCCL